MRRVLAKLSNIRSDANVIGKRAMQVSLVFMGGGCCCFPSFEEEWDSSTIASLKIGEARF